MKRKWMRRLFVLGFAVIFLLSACTSYEAGSENNSDALTWGTWGSYGNHQQFLELLGETYPEIELEYISYTGANRTEYSWAQMRADDIPDIFITSQILDEELAKERLVDLSGYPFINNISTAVLDQAEIDGGIYLLPISYSVYGIFYNKTLMEEKNWEVPENFGELEALCAEIESEGMTPGIIATQLTGCPFSAVFNLAKTDWLTTPEGITWEKDFLAGNAGAEGTWEDTMAYVQQYVDIGMFSPDPEDRDHDVLVSDYLGNRKAMFCVAVHAINRTTAGKDGGDELGIMPYISRDGSKNVYMYSPTCYFGISSRLTEPGNEEKLEEAVLIMSLLFSEEGQAALLGENPATTLSVLDSHSVPEDSMVYDAQQAMREGRAFPMTYAHWENVLADMGQAYKEWFRGENDMDGEKCIRQMDELQQTYLNQAESFIFCKSTADFSLEETASLVGQALGSAAGADGVMVPIGEFHDGVELKAGITGRFYEGDINGEISKMVCPALDGEYAVMEMTGAQALELAEGGLDAAGDGNPFPYILVIRKGLTLDDDTTYRIAFFAQGYTEEMAQDYSAENCKGSVRSFLHTYLEEQGQITPGENYWDER